MNSVNKIRIRNKYSYFYITEDPPFDLDTASPADRLRLRPSQVNNYFFIDFTQKGSLRQMTKLVAKASQYSEPLKLQKYGRSIVTNVEDSSAGQQKLLKFQEQMVKLNKQRSRIRQKINNSLQKSKKKRAYSEFAIKQKLIDQLTLPINVNHHDEQSFRVETISNRLQSKQRSVLRRLGFLHGIV